MGQTAADGTDDTPLLREKPNEIAVTPHEAQECNICNTLDVIQQMHYALSPF